ncbi:MAG TPA: alanine--glyoxylate aminotransferase family protein [Acidobacteriota bacterium]|nr:alanine--glyoxylate aminotransferase family protein [Acidobacteriota bacterium]
MSISPATPDRLLLGPGPSNTHPRVREAQSRPLLGHLDPAFLEVMNEVQDLLRYVFETSNRMTIPISGTGSAGMECAVCNFVEEGDSVLVGVHGVFGARIAECARRAGGEVHTVEAPFGEPLDSADLQRSAEEHRPKIIAVVQAETSTGVLQPLEPIRSICDLYDALLLVDAVTSLGGHPVRVDHNRIDICYSGTQKCLSCPPGLAPLTASEEAMLKLSSRRRPVRSWYLDLSLLASYWGSDRAYHHTAPISMNYALREALRLVHEEGLQTRWGRHRSAHQALVAGIEAMGLKMHVEEPYRLWPLNTVSIPEGISDADVRKRLLSEFNIEIGGGLGALAGKVWRIGLMGHNATPRNVLFFLHALEQCLQAEGFSLTPGAAPQAASTAFQHPAPVE